MAPEQDSVSLVVARVVTVQTKPAGLRSAVIWRPPASWMSKPLAWTASARPEEVTAGHLIWNETCRVVRHEDARALRRRNGFGFHLVDDGLQFDPGLCVGATDDLRCDLEHERGAHVGRPLQPDRRWGDVSPEQPRAGRAGRVGVLPRTFAASRRSTPISRRKFSRTFTNRASITTCGPGVPPSARPTVAG